MQEVEDIEGKTRHQNELSGKKKPEITWPQRIPENQLSLEKAYKKGLQD